MPLKWILGKNDDGQQQFQGFFAATWIYTAKPKD